MVGKLKGQVALVTGGTGGIGEAAVRRLAADGATVHFTGSREEAARKVCDDTGATFHAHRVQDEEGWTKLMAAIDKAEGRLDTVFANAGIERGDGSVENVVLENWNEIIAVNQTGVMLTMQHAIRAMRKNPDGPKGSIIVNSSMNAHRAMGNFVAYSVTKAAVVALVKSAAVHCGQSGTQIRCNAILPGVVETDMIRGVIARQDDPDAARAAYEGMSPMNRMAQLDEVAAMVAYLASDEAGFVNGAELVIDGGSTAGMMGV